MSAGAASRRWWHTLKLWVCCHVPTASALEALTWIQQGQQFDAAIIDVLNSEMHGLTLASEIRRYHDAHALPLILGRYAWPAWYIATGRLKAIIRCCCTSRCGCFSSRRR